VGGFRIPSYPQEDRDRRPGSKASHSGRRAGRSCRVARLLNERKLDPHAALQSYDRIITSHVRVRSEQKQLNRAQSDTLGA